jgi:TP901 family phage tail tape measure protein
MADNLTSATIDVRANTRGMEKDILKALRTVEFSQVNTKKSSQALGRITGQVSEFNKSLEASNARVVAFGASAGAIFAVEKAFSSLISSTIEVEKKLTDINVILGLSSSGLEKFGDSLFSVAKNTAQSFTSVADAAIELSRQGLGVEETLKRTNAALILTRLSGLDAKSSVEALTATLNSFAGSALDAVEVVNKLANVDAAFAVSSADLANAISRVGSTAVDAGVSLDELIALVTSAQQTTARGGSVIGNSFKTIFTRLQRGKVQDLLGSLGVDTSETQSAISLLQQLATTYDTLGATQRAYVAEQVGGVFQINILRAALSDLGKEYSIFGRALDTSLSSTDQAIRRNELLNQTVSALSTQAVANLEQAANKIGSIVFEPNAKSFLSGFNNILNSFNNIDAESAGGKLMTGFFKGIGDFISGPGAVLTTAVVVKLFATLSKFASGSIRELLGVNKAAQQQAGIEQSILSILQKNNQFTSQILSGKITTVQAEKELLNYLTAQSNILREQERLSKVIGANLAKAGISIGASGVPMAAAAAKGKKAASSGYVPNFAADQVIGQAMENSGAKQHGYKAGKARKTTIHDGNGKSFKSFVNSKEDVKTFTNAAGKKATIVRPPNGFGENTQYAAGGFVPNFAKKRIASVFKSGSSLKALYDTGPVFDMYNDSAILKYESLPKKYEEYRKEGRFIFEEARKIYTNSGNDIGKANSYISKRIPGGFSKKLSKDYFDKPFSENAINPIVGALGEKDFFSNNPEFSKLEDYVGPDFKKGDLFAEVKILRKKISEKKLLEKALRGAAYSSPKKTFKNENRDVISPNLIFASAIKESMSSGFVPNFASKMQEFYKNLKMKEGQQDPFGKRAAKANLAAKTGAQIKDLGNLEYTMIHAGGGGNFPARADFLKKDKKTNSQTQYTAKIGTAGLDTKKIIGGSIENRVGDALVTEANNLAKTFNPSGGTQFSNYKQLSNTGSVFSAAGTVFESAVRQAFNVPAQGQGDRIDFPSPNDQLRSFFGNATGPYEAKISNTADNRSSTLSKWVAVKGLGQGFVPNFAGSRSGGLSFVQKDKDEFGFSELQAIMGGKRVGSFSYAEDKPGRLDVGDFTVNKSERGRGIGSELYKEAIRRNAGKKMKGQLLPQMNRLLQKMKRGEPVSAETLYPQIKRADLAKSSVFEVHGHKGMTVEKMNRDQFASFVNAKITELKKDPKKLQSYFGNVEADEYGGLGVDLQTQHSSGFVPNFASGIITGDVIRGNEYKSVLDFLAKTNKPVRTIIGPSGSGKTTMASKSGGSIVKSFNDLAGFDSYILDRATMSMPKDEIVSENLKKIFRKSGESGALDLLVGSRNTIRSLREKRAQEGDLLIPDRKQLSSGSGGVSSFVKGARGFASEYPGTSVSRIFKDKSEYKTKKILSEGFVPNFADTRMIQQKAFYSQAAEPWLSGKKIKPTFDPLKGIDFQNIELDKIKSGRFVHSEGVSGKNVYSTEEFKNIYNKNKMNRSFWRRRSFEYLSKSSGFIPSFASPQLISEINKRVKNPNIAQKLQEGTGLKDAAYVKAASRLGVDVSGLDYLLPQMGFPLRGKDKVLKLSKALGFGFGRSFILDALKMGDWNYVKPKFEPLGLGKDDFDKLSKYANTPKGESALRWWRSPSSKSAGFVPNFASALNDAISREKSAGLSSSQIYVDQHSSLKNSKNPMGLMVANTRDEPRGGIQGIKRAKKEGRNPKTYGGGMSSGYVPNFALNDPGTFSALVRQAAGAGGSTAGEIENAQVTVRKAIKKFPELGSEFENVAKEFEGLSSDVDAWIKKTKELGSSASKSKSPTEGGGNKLERLLLNDSRQIVFSRAGQTSDKEAKAQQRRDEAEAKARAAAQGEGSYQTFAMGGPPASAPYDRQRRRAELIQARKNAPGREGLAGGPSRFSKSIIGKGFESVKQNPLGVGFGLQALSGSVGELMGGGDEATGVGKATKAISDAVGTFSSFAATGAMFGPKGALIGAGVGLTKAIYDSVKTLNSSVPELEKAYQLSSDSLNRFGESGQKILQLNEQYADALKSGNPAQAADIMMKNQQAYAEELSKLTEAQRGTLVSAIAQGKGQEGYGKILAELQDSAKAQESALLLQKFQESGGPFGGPDKKIIEGIDKNLVQDLTRGLDAESIQSALDNVANVLQDPTAGTENQAVTLMRSLASSESFSADQKANFEKVIDSFASAAANTDLSKVAEGFLKGVAGKPKAFDDLKKFQDANKAAVAAEAEKRKREIEIREKANVSLLKLQAETESVYQRFNNSIEDFISSMETAAELRANAGEFRADFYSQGGVPAAAESQKEKNILRSNADKLNIDVKKSQFEASDGFRKGVDNLLSGVSADAQKLRLDETASSQENELLGIKSTLEQALLPVQQMLLGGQYGQAREETKRVLGGLTEEQKSAVGSDKLVDIGNELDRSIQESARKQDLIYKNSQKDLAIQAQQLVFQRATAKLARAQNFGGAGIKDIIKDSPDAPFNQAINSLKDLKILGFNQKDLMQGRENAVRGGGAETYGIRGEKPNAAMSGALVDFYNAASQISGEPVLSTQSKDFGALTQAVSDQIRKKLEELKIAGEGVVDPVVFARIESTLATLGGDDKVSQLKIIKDLGVADVGGKQILDETLKTYSGGAFEGLSPDLKKAFGATTDEGAAATLLLIAGQEKQTNSLSQGLAAVAGVGRGGNDLLAAQPDAIAAAIGAILEKGRAEQDYIKESEKFNEAAIKRGAGVTESKRIAEQIRSKEGELETNRKNLEALGFSEKDFSQKELDRAGEILGGGREAYIKENARVWIGRGSEQKNDEERVLAGQRYDQSPEVARAINLKKAFDLYKGIQQQESEVGQLKNKNEGISAQDKTLLAEQEAQRERVRIAREKLDKTSKKAAVSQNLMTTGAGSDYINNVAATKAAQEQSLADALAVDNLAKTDRQKEAVARSSGKQTMLSPYSGQQETYEKVAVTEFGGANAQAFAKLRSQNVLPSLEQFSEVYKSMGAEGGAKGAFEKLKAETYGIQTAAAKKPPLNQQQSAAGGGITVGQNQALLNKFGYKQGEGFSSPELEKQYKEEVKKLKESKPQSAVSAPTPASTQAAPTTQQPPVQPPKQDETQQNINQIISNILATVQQIATGIENKPSAETGSQANAGATNAGDVKDISVNNSVSFSVNANAQNGGGDQAAAVAEQIRIGLSSFLSSPEFVGKVTSIANQAAGNKIPPKV